MNTKERILEEALKLFSVSGYEAVSIRQIASAVGVANSALYKHYKSKREILEAIMESAKVHYQERAQMYMKSIHDFSNMKEVCLQMYQFQTQDEWMVRIRRVLMMEQFRNQEMASLYREFFIDQPIQIMTAIFEQLIAQGIMKKGNSEVMAMELYAPFYLYHTVTKDNVEELFQKHVNQFLEAYVIE